MKKGVKRIGVILAVLICMTALSLPVWGAGAKNKVKISGLKITDTSGRTLEKSGGAYQVDYPTKKVKVVFTAKVTSDAKIKSVTIGGKKRSVKTKKLAKGKYSCTATVPVSKKYFKKTSWKITKMTLKGGKTVKANGTVKLQTIYTLSLKNVSAQVDRKNKKVVVRFQATVSDKARRIKKVKFNSTQYSAAWDKNKKQYTVQIPYTKETRQSYTLKSVVLDNKKTVTVGSDALKNRVITVFKTAPAANVENPVYRDGSVSVKWKLTDKDATVTKLYAVLKQDGGENLEEELNASAREVTFVGVTSDSCSVEILGDYDLSDGVGAQVRMPLGASDSLIVQTGVDIKTESISEKYPEKGDKIEISYRILDNAGAKAAKLVINNIQYSLEETGRDDIYKLSYTAPETAGVHELKVTGVIFDNDVSVDLTEKPHTDKIDVLKEKPSITGFSQVDNLEKEMVMFTFEVSDPDGAFEKGEAKVVDETKTVHRGSNTLWFSVTPDDEHNLLMNIYYDRTSGQLDGEEKEKYRDVLTHSEKFTLTADYALSVSDLKTFKKDGDEEARYFAKNEEIQLRFHCTNKTELTPIGVRISDPEDESANGVWLEVAAKQAEDGSPAYYYAMTCCKAEPGTERIEISGIRLSSGREIDKDEFKENAPSAEIEILKDKPEMSDLNVSNDESSVTISFRVFDPDQAMTDSRVRVTDDADGSEAYNEKVAADYNTHTVSLTPGKKYTLIIEKNYDLNSVSGDEANRHSEIFEKRELEIAKKEEPNFIARNLSVPKRIANGGKVPLTFENRVMSYLDVSDVTVDGKDYPVSKDENGVYRVELEPGKEGVNTIRVQSVKMGGKTFAVNRALSYIHEYIVPALETADEEISEDTANNEAVVSYTLNDPHSAVRSLKAYMRNSVGKVVATKEIPLEDTSLRMTLIKSYRYLIDLKAEYDVGDGKTLETTTLKTWEKDADPRVTIVEESIGQEYADKGSDVVLTYRINTNFDQDLRKVFIGDISYSASKVKDEEDTYQITVPAPEKAGVFTQKVTQMQVGNNNYKVEDPNPVEIRVRKDKPTLTHFIIDEQENSLSFRINDEDGALGQDTVFTVADESGREISENRLTDGGKEYSFDLKKLGLSKIGAKYHVEVSAAYDQDPADGKASSILQKIQNLFAAEDGGTAVTEELFAKDVTLSGDIEYNFTFEDVAGYYIFSMNGAENDTAVEFDSENASPYEPEKVIIDGKEYPVSARESQDSEHRYQVDGYRPSSYDQEQFHYNQVILENGAAFDVSDAPYMMVLREDYSFDVTDVEEDLEEQKIRFRFRLTDRDEKIVSDLKFSLSNSQNQLIGTASAKVSDNLVEFDIPNPPTAKYKLNVTADVTEVTYIPPRNQTVFSGEFDSKVNTSILDSRPSTRYPRKGETIEIEYTISSTKVVLVDMNDHEMLSKAVNITSLVINGKEYNVEHLEGEKYRLYYTVQNDDGLEKLNVSQINFSNGETEEFYREDVLEVLRDAPSVSGYRTENDPKAGTVRFTFKLADPDGVLAANKVYAQVNDGEKRELEIGENDVTFQVQPDELSLFKISADYDLDMDALSDEGEDENSYTDHVFFERQFFLADSYGIEFKDVRTYNTKGEETRYFEKKEDIRVTFDFGAVVPLTPETVVIEGETCELQRDEKSGRYSLTIKGYDKAGPVEAAITSVTLSSGNVVDLGEKKASVEFEILKDAVKVDSMKHGDDENDAGRICLTIDTSDADGSNREMRLAVSDEYGQEMALSQETLSVGENTVSFEKTTAGKYFVSVYADYDRDSDPDDQENFCENSRVYYEVITVVRRKIEIKDIVDIQLYLFGESGSVERVDSLSEDQLDILDNCLVKVTMRDLPTFYSKITDRKVTEDGKLKLSLDYSEANIYDGTTLRASEVTLDILEDKQYGYKGSFKSLLESMKKNPNGTFTLGKDYDLSGFATNTDGSEAVMDFEFKGTLDGNGHTISNLRKPLFKTMRNASVKNVVFKHIAYDEATGRAVVVKNGYGAKISNVHVEGVTFSGNRSNTAVFAYELKDHSLVENCSAVDVRFSTNYLGQANAGGVSYLYGSVIRNCYVQGRISSGWHFNGGLVAKSDSGAEISGNIVNMSVTPYYGLNEPNGGIVSIPGGALLKNNLSLVSSGSNIPVIYGYGQTIAKGSADNYYLKDTTSWKNEAPGICAVAREEINEEFFLQKLHFNRDIWNLEGASIDHLPTLKGAAASYKDEGIQPENAEVYIPDYSRFVHLDGYRSDREVVYHNMYKLMPFYDAKEILRDGNKIDENDLLSRELIKYVLPYDKNGRLVSVLTMDNYDSLDKIGVVFESGAEKEYHIDFDDYYGNVAFYIVSDLNVGYSYREYVMDTDADIVKELVETASGYDYAEDLDPLTPDEDSRLYREFYERVTKNEIADFVEKMLANIEFIPTFESDVLDVLIRQEVLDNDNLKKMLFAYNYFRYWYDLDMDGVNVADSIMFHGDEMFHDEMKLSAIAAELTAGSNSATGGTGNFYSNYLAKYTGKDNLGDFLDYYVTCLTDYESGDQWFKENWHGGIYETVSVEVKDQDHVYDTLWDHFRRSGNTQNSFLPLFTMPENSMYIITAPTQVCYGSLRVYVRNPDDPAEMEKFRNEKVTKFMNELRGFYQFAYDYIGSEYLNRYVDQEYDMRTTYTVTGSGTIYNNPKTTVEPYHKYFAEALNKWPASNGTGAYANGSEVYWTVIKMMDNGFAVGTHETLHNQDSKIFLKGYGRRGTAEDYTAGNLQQYFNDGWISPNVMGEFTAKDGKTQNNTYARIDTDDKLQDYYEKMFELNDLLDYIEAKAFLQLDDEEKAKVAVQVSYPKLSAEEQEKGDSTVQYEPLTTEQIRNMKLQSVSDLWDNRIMLRPGVKTTQVSGPGASTDSLYNIRWYQPHADDGRADGPNFKWLAWEMASIGGYYDGYMAYFSQNYIGSQTGQDGLATNDLIALRYITGDDDITFRDYKLGRYDEMESHWDEENAYIDVDEVCKAYLAALRSDAKNNDRKLTASTNVKRTNFLRIKAETNDFMDSIFSQSPAASQAEEIASESSRTQVVSFNAAEETAVSEPDAEETTVPDAEEQAAPDAEGQTEPDAEEELTEEAADPMPDMTETEEAAETDSASDSPAVSAEQPDSMADTE